MARESLRATRELSDTSSDFPRVRSLEIFETLNAEQRRISLDPTQQNVLDPRLAISKKQRGEDQRLRIDDRMPAFFGCCRAANCAPLLPRDLRYDFFQFAGGFIYEA
ncbi:MAG TPA: hypothetical protein VGQ30_02240 [Gemmatimonadaceae bacterium]|nr:hypothetical protein [Gemmatimonadaceae bacterium]